MSDKKEYDKAIVGLGATGFSCLRFLHNQGERVVVNDSRAAPANFAQVKKDFPDVPIHLGEFSESVLRQANEIIVSQGISYTEPALQTLHAEGTKFLSDVELLARFTQQPIIAITGSNGKSTVTTLVGAFAKACQCNAGVGGNLSLIHI